MSTLKRKIVIFGCKKIAIDIIRFIRNYRKTIGVTKDGKKIIAELVGVVTHDEEEDLLYGNKLVSEICNHYKIRNIRYQGKIVIDPIKKLNPDIIFSIYYRRLLPKEIIDFPKLGCINLHPALLPKDRGPNPTYWVVRRGDRFAGTTIHYLDEGMDTGDIITSTKVVTGKRTGFELSKYLMNVGFKLFKKNYVSIMCEKNKRKPQIHKKATCNILFRNNMRYIDWCEKPDNIINHIRAHTKPYAGSIAWTKNGNKILIYHAKKLTRTIRSCEGPGAYTIRQKRKLFIQTYEKPILVDDYHMEQGKLEPKGRFISGVPE